MILANGCNITKSEKFKWVFPYPLYIFSNIHHLSMLIYIYIYIRAVNRLKYLIAINRMIAMS